MREILTYLIGRVGPAAIGFSAIIAYSHYVSPDQYGMFAAALACSNILNLTLHQWLRITLTRFCSAESEDEENYLYIIIVIHFIINISIIITSLTFYMLLGGVFFVILTASIMLSAMSFSDLVLEYLRCKGRAAGYSILYFVRQTSTAAISLLMISFEVGYGALVCGVVVGSLGPAAFMVSVKLNSKIFRKIKVENLKELLKFGLPLSVNYGASAVLNYTDTVVVFVASGSFISGLYALSAELARQLIIVVMEAINLPAFPRAVKAFHEKGTGAAIEQLKLNFSILMLVSLPVVTGLVLSTPDVARFFLNRTYEEAATGIIPLVALATFLRGCRVFYFDQAFHMAKQTQEIYKVTAISAIFAILSCIGMVYAFGYIGAGIAAVASSFVALSISRYYGQKVWPLAIPMSDLAKIVFSTVAMASLVSVIGPSPDVVHFIFKATLGALLYASTAVALNVCRLRDFILGVLR